MTQENWKTVAQIGQAIFAAVGVIWGLKIYRRNSRLERAKWITSLYEKFFENDHLKKVRNALDVLSDSAEVVKVNELVSREKPEFTDYLNFFEYVAILRESKQLGDQEIYDLFNYYLGCLERHENVRRYIEENGYEQLHALLKWHSLLKRRPESWWQRILLRYRK